MVELKSLVADRMQEQGTQMDANDISDETLYDLIATNANLRASISTFLRARGYVTEGDLQTSRSNAGDGSADNELPSAQHSSSLADNAKGAASLAAGAGPGSLDENGLPTASTPSMSSGGVPGSGEKRGHEEVNASTDLPRVLRQPAPYNLRSMRDLYTQIPERTVRLKRFGSEVFVNRDIYAAARGISSLDTPLDVPLGPDYVVGPGDTLRMGMWGGVTESITRVVGRDGRILLPEAGSLAIAGLSLEQAQSLIESALKHQFRNAQVAVTISRLRSVRVYVVGDVQRPGGYDISSLATPLSALYAAGGPTSVGSLRTLRHYRAVSSLSKISISTPISCFMEFATQALAL